MDWRLYGFIHSELRVLRALYVVFHDEGLRTTAIRLIHSRPGSCRCENAGTETTSQQRREPESGGCG